MPKKRRAWPPQPFMQRAPRGSLGGSPGCWRPRDAASGTRRPQGSGHAWRAGDADTEPGTAPCLLRAAVPRAVAQAVCGAVLRRLVAAAGAVRVGATAERCARRSTFSWFRSGPSARGGRTPRCSGAKRFQGIQQVLGHVRPIRGQGLFERRLDLGLQASGMWHVRLRSAAPRGTWSAWRMSGSPGAMAAQVLPIGHRAPCLHRKVKHPVEERPGRPVRRWQRGTEAAPIPTEPSRIT